MIVATSHPECRATGPACILALAQEGFTLHCHDPKFDNLDTREQFVAQHPDVHISDTTEPESLIAEVLKQHGRVDCLISNDCGYVASADADASDFRRALEILTVTPYRLAMAAVPAMRQAGGGSIVLITSGGPLTRPVMQTDEAVPTNYLVARDATNALVRCLALVLAEDDIQVNAIAPYMIYSQTFFPSAIGPEDPKFPLILKAKVPMRRFGRDEEFALLVTALASGRAKFISGQVIAFSGAGA